MVRPVQFPLLLTAALLAGPVGAQSGAAIKVPAPAGGSQRGQAPDPMLSGKVYVTQQGESRYYRFDGVVKNIGDAPSIAAMLLIKCSLSGLPPPKNTCPQVGGGNPNHTMLPIKELAPGESVPFAFEVMTVDESKSSWTTPSYKASVDVSVAYNGAPVPERTFENNSFGYSEMRQRRQ